MRCFLTSLLLLLLGAPASGQIDRFHGYATNLSANFDFGSSDLNDIAEDWNGFIWIGSDDGLFRFDGTVVRRFTHGGQDTTLLHNTVFKILVDEQRRVLWLGTANGLSRFDPATESVTHYQFDPDDPNSLADNFVAYVYMDRAGRIWVGTFNYGMSLYRPDTDDFQNFWFDVPAIDSLQAVHPIINESRLNSIKFIVQDRADDDLYWLGTARGPISFRYSDETFNWLFLQKSDPYLMRTVSVLHQSEDHLIIGTEELAYIYDIQTGSHVLLDPQVDSPRELRFVIQIIPIEDELYISFANGATLIGAHDHQIRESWIDNKSLNRHYGIRLVDSQDRAWVYSSRAMVMYDPSKQVSQSFWLPDDGAGAPLVLKELEDGQILMLTTNPRYYHIFDRTSGTWTSVRISGQGVNWNGVLWKDMAVLDKDRWLLLSEQSPFVLNLTENVLQPFKLLEPIENPKFNNVILDQRGNIWLSTIRVGLFRINLETGEVRHFLDELNSRHSTSLYTWITDLFEDSSGRIWIRLARSFATYDPARDEIQIVSHRENAKHTFRYIGNFAEDARGNIWAGSFSEGIGLLNAEQPEEGLKSKITVNDGLLSMNVSRIESDIKNRLWVLTDAGITVYEHQSGQYQNYPWDRGIPRSSLFATLGDGKVALALPQGGVNILNPDLLERQSPPPLPYVTEVRMEDRIKFRSGNRTQLTNLDVYSGRNYLSFSFSALGYTNPKLFAYQLGGVDNDWVMTNELKTVSYSNLSPGTYPFSLKAKLEGGSWSEVKKMQVYFAPKWYETTIFKAGALALLIAGVYLTYRWRLNNVKRQERFRSEFQQKLKEVEMQALRAQMNPHFLFNSLNSIENYIIKNDPAHAVDYLNRFSRLVRLILQNSRSKTVPLKDDLEALELYIGLERMRFKVQFDYEIQVAPDIQVNDVEIPPMLMQPFVENAIWHGIQHLADAPVQRSISGGEQIDTAPVKGKILIKIRTTDEQLLCTIEDNGVGRKEALERKKQSVKKHRSMGMKITEDRLDIINRTVRGQASLNIIDLYAQGKIARGTRVELRLPL